jgi:hypothetical protein
VKLLWVPAHFRGDDDPNHAKDTSYHDRFIKNRMGVSPSGKARPNGNDFWWDGEGTGTCFQGNTGPGGRAVTHKSPTFPGCPGARDYSVGDFSMTASQASCSTWDENDPNTWYPPGCDWFTRPPKPSSK